MIRTFARRCFASSSDTTSAVSSLISDALAEARTTTTIISSEPRNWKFTSAVIDTSPHKALLVVKMLYKLNLRQALTQLTFSKKKSAIRVSALLNRAYKSIQHNTLYKISTGDSTIRPPPPSIEHFEITRVIVGKGIYRRDLRYHGRGMTGIVHHPSCRVKITLTEILDQERVDSYAGLASGRRQSDFDRLCYAMKRCKPKRHGVNDDRKLLYTHAPWSRKPWKYVSSAKWTNPDSILFKKRQ